MELAKVFQPLAIALGLGLLIGLQRERTNARVAGFRTFPLIALLGALCALLAQTFGGWILAVGLGGLALLIVVGNLPKLKTTGEAPGVTTEAAMLVTYAVGACLVAGYTAVAIAVGGVVAVLLHLKPEMHALAAEIEERDFKAIMQFALISLVVLPVLPNQAYGPYQALNPFKMWLMVVLIVGISLGGYIVYKFAGPRAGTLATGILGGVISSTATTVGLSRRSKQNSGSPALAAFVILAASSVVFIRVALLLGATSPRFAAVALGRLAVMCLVLALLGLWSWRGQRAQPAPVPDQGNPSELKPALMFAVLYAAVLVGVAAAKDYFGNTGLYAVAVLSGLTDMDAITLSVSQMVHQQNLPPDTGWRVILVASMSNLVFKAGIVAVLGTRALFRRIAAAFLVALAAGAGLLLF